MFGDVGHGGLWCLITLYMFLNQDKLKKAGLGGIVNYRFLVLLMSLFAVYCGALYNEFFSIPLDTFGSCYTNTVVG